MGVEMLTTTQLFFSYAALTNLISDVAVAIVPFPFLFSLRMCPIKKLAIGGMLLTGAIVIVASIGRTYAFFTVGHNLDYTWENYDYIVWTSVEPCVGVIGCCLPTLRPLFTKNGDATCTRYYLRHVRGGTSPEGQAPWPASGMEAPLYEGPCVEKGGAVQHQGTFLSQSSTSEASCDLSGMDSPRALFNATPRLTKPHARA